MGSHHSSHECCFVYVRDGLYINGEIACGGGEGAIHQSELSVICELGRGACGVVRKMRRLDTNEYYAVKVRERGRNPHQSKSKVYC